MKNNRQTNNIIEIFHNIGRSALRYIWRKYRDDCDVHRFPKKSSQKCLVIWANILIYLIKICEYISCSFYYSISDIILKFDFPIGCHCNNISESFWFFHFLLKLWCFFRVCSSTAMIFLASILWTFSWYLLFTLLSYYSMK